MKKCVFLLGMITLSISIIIFGVRLSQAIERAGSGLNSSLSYFAELLRGTLLTISERN